MHHHRRSEEFVLGGGAAKAANFEKMKFGTRRQRRQDRDAVGIEGVRNGEGNPRE